MGFPRILVVLPSSPGPLRVSSPAAKQPAGPSPSPTMAATVAPAPAAEPAVPACGDGPALLASMTTRDKLAQLLMVGVTGAADARAVVDSHHVGGIFIGSWTDMSMLSDGSLSDIAASAGPLPLAVSVDEEGGRVSRLAGLIGSQPSPRVLASSPTPDEVYNIALQRGQAMRKLGITIDFAPVVDVTNAPADTGIGDRSFGADPPPATDYPGAPAPSAPSRRQAPTTQAPTPADCATPACCRCLSTSPATATARATRTPEPWGPRPSLICRPTT